MTYNTNENQPVKIKDWNYIQEHNHFVTAIPEMEPFCGKDATITNCVAEAPVPYVPNIYHIAEDEGKYMWSQEWFENREK